MTLQVGSTVGPYAIAEPIGAGGMGQVYRARDPRLGRDVALKILLPELGSSAVHLRRFELEARAASALNHPGIVAIYDVGHEGSLAYIAMELVEGQTLRAQMKGGSLTLRESLRIMSKVADVLAAAHERGIIHRDLKPENLIVATGGYVKVLDFGLAKLVQSFASDDDLTTPQTRPGMVLGTVAYMSPEQASGCEVDFRSDQFSMGVILYEVVSGRRPFAERTAAETMASIIRNEPVPLSQAATSVPPEIERIVTRLLSKEPRDRYGSTLDLARDLREVRQLLTHPSYSGRRSAADEPKRPVVGRGLLAAGIAIALAAGAGSWVYLRPETPAKVAPRKISMAVLPFRSAAAEDQSFTDGLAASITTRLASVTSLHVLPPFDVHTAPDESPVSIARKRQADMLLRGRVERSADTVRLAFEVIDGASGKRVAGDSISGSASGIFAFEEAAASSILKALNVDSIPSRPATTAAAVRPANQRLYMEALGSLQNPENEAAVDQALERLHRLLEDERDSPAVNTLQARALVSKYGVTRRSIFAEQAAIFADRAVQLDPGSPDAHAAIGDVKLVMGKYAEAAAEFERVLTAEPGRFDAVLALARAYNGLGRASDAEKRFIEATALRPDLARAFNLYGAFCFNRSRYEKAVELYQRVVTLTPQSARGFSNLGASYQALGRYDDALAAHRRAMTLSPTAISYSNLGSCEFSLGRFSDSVASFEKATKLTPDNYILWCNLGDAYRWAPGMRERSLKAYSQAARLAHESLAINPRDAMAHALVAGALAKSGKLDEAGAEIDTALRIDPTSSVVLYQAGVVAILRGSLRRGSEWIGQALDSGYGTADAARDPELSPIRETVEFRQHIDKMKKTS